MPRESGAYAASEPIFADIYETWLQHHFPFYKIQSPDITQMPRMPALDEAFAQNFRPTSTNQFPLVGRLWQLTNTRYVLGSRSSLDFLNQNIDRGQGRFRVHTAFDFAPTAKAPATGPRQIEEITAVTRPEGRFGIFEFTGALPRAALFTHWETSTNETATLARLADPTFDPTKTVLVSTDTPAPASNTATNQPAGSVQITAYAPKEVDIKVQATTSAILLLNDRYDQDWHVRVDGKLQPVLRLNYIMRGVYLPAGDHTIEFRFEPPLTTLYVSVLAIASSLLLCGILVLTSRSLNSSAISESNAANSKISAPKNA
jgi:hypothetical protein